MVTFMRTVCSLTPTANSSPPPMHHNKRRKVTQRRLEDMAQFVQRHGHALVPCNETTGLGRWAAEQRIRWKAGKLSIDTYRALSALGFNFDSQSAQWMSRFRQLAQFHTDNGHCNVTEAAESQYPGLPQWVIRQRFLWKEGRLEEDRFRRLDGLDFQWQPRSVGWEAKFADLAVYKATYGHCNVPKGSEDHPQLAAWVENMRNAYKTGRLSKNRQQRLVSLGFEFEPGEAAWQERAQQLQQLATTTTTDMSNSSKQFDLSSYATFPKTGKYAGLAEWLAQQRLYHRQGRLSAARVARLESIPGFQWENKSWTKRVEALDNFIGRHGYVAAYWWLQLVYDGGSEDNEEESTPHWPPTDLLLTENTAGYSSSNTTTRMSPQVDSSTRRNTTMMAMSEPTVNTTDGDKQLLKWWASIVYHGRGMNGQRLRELQARGLML